MEKKLGNKREWQIANPEFRDFVKQVKDTVDKEYTSVATCNISGLLDNEISYPLILNARFCVAGNTVAIDYDTDGFGRKGFANITLINYRRDSTTKEVRYELKEADKAAKFILFHCFGEM